MKKLSGAALIVFAASAPAFGESNLPFEQTQLDRGEAVTRDASRGSARQDGGLEGSSNAGATAQPGSHHNVQSPVQRRPAEAGAPAPAPDLKYPLQPVPDPYNPV